MSVTFTAELSGDPVDMNNSNAVRMLDALGYAEPYGDKDARLPLGRVLLALVPADAGRSAVADGRFIDCGRARGYAQSRLSELRELAEYAQAPGPARQLGLTKRGAVDSWRAVGGTARRAFAAVADGRELPVMSRSQDRAVLSGFDLLSWGS